MALSILPASVHTPREVTRADTGTREGSLHAQWALIWSPPAMATCSITLRMTDIGARDTSRDKVLVTSHIWQPGRASSSIRALKDKVGSS